MLDILEDLKPFIVYDDVGGEHFLLDYKGYRIQISPIGNTEVMWPNVTKYVWYRNLEDLKAKEPELRERLQQHDRYLKCLRQPIIVEAWWKAITLLVNSQVVKPLNGILHIRNTYLRDAPRVDQEAVQAQVEKRQRDLAEFFADLLQEARELTGAPIMYERQGGQHIFTCGQRVVTLLSKDAPDKRPEMLRALIDRRRKK